jgi:hypothetical protein
MFYLILPIIVIFPIAYRELAKILWSVILTIVGFFIVNYLFSYFFLSPKSYHFLISIYIIYLSIGCILFGYIFTLQSFLPIGTRDTIERTPDTDAIRYFNGFFVAIFLLPLFTTMSSLAFYGKVHEIYSLSFGYQYALGSLIFGGVIFLLEFLRVPIKTLNYFSKPLYRFKADKSKITKYLIIGMIIFLIFSATNELQFRRNWILWSETMILFILYFSLILKLGAILYEPTPSSMKKPSEVKLPSLKDKGNAILIGFLIFVDCISLIIAAIE